MAQNDEEKKKNVRQHYRRLIEDTNKNKYDLVKPECTGLSETLDQANVLFKEVKKLKGAREAAMDSQLLVLLSNLGNQQAHKLHSDLVTFNPTDFAEKLVTFMDGDRGKRPQERKISKNQWAKLGNYAMKSFRVVPPFKFMLGSFPRGDIEVKRRANRCLSSKDVGPKVRPVQLTSIDSDSCEITTEETEKLLKILQSLTVQQDGSYEPICFFEFIVHPTSFSQTIENMFRFSFLVRDGHASVFLDEDDLPAIEPHAQYNEKKHKNAVRNQVVVSMTEEEWREIVKVYNITKPRMPDRSTWGTRGGRGNDSEAGPSRRRCHSQDSDNE